MSRPLTLHVSALNDAEFTTYTSSIHDIVDYDPDHAAPTLDYEKLTVGVREARAWLRGRYPTIAPSTLDTILRLFCPDLGPADVVTGGQFFAALRLVSHVLAGKEVDPTLVFVQAHPDELASRSPSPLGKQSRLSAKVHPQPTHTTPDPPSPDHNPFFAAAQPSHHSTAPAVSPVSAPAVTRPAPPSVPPKPNNPFLNRRGSQDAPPQSAPASTPVFPGSRPSASASHDGKIPPLPPRKPPVLPPPRHASMGAPHAQPSREVPPPVPALPARSVSASNPNVLIQQSLQATRIAQSLKKAEQRLEQERVMEVLKSSSSSGAVNPSMRRVRSKSPVKESHGPGPGPGSSSASSRSGPSATGAVERPTLHRRVPSLPPRRNLSPPASTTGTARSFEQVATATLSPFKRGTLPPDPPPPLPPARRFASQSNSPSRTPPRPLADLPPEPPPMHPDRKSIVSSATDPDRPISSSTPTPRVVRSKSMHQPSPPPVPPPPRRKRPESVQLTPGQVGDSPFGNASVPSVSASTPPNMSLSRHLSLSSTRERERERQRGRESRERSREGSSGAFPETAIGSLQKTLTSLQLRAQPALDAARYKAEGAFSRRGFVQHGSHGPRWMREEGEARLMDDVDDAFADADVDADADANLDRGARGRRDVEGRAGVNGGGRTVGRGRTWGGEEIGDDDSSLDHDPGEDSEKERERVEARARRWREGGVDVAVVDDGRRMVLERDDLKWPAGDGWRPL
ncbi:hypothetical protein C8Q77DRAFT_1103458 [Trametes polyzona]|nr:hypothetical protein C8Q77DRAFT_1103458 [Trametes polyzona]